MRAHKTRSGPPSVCPDASESTTKRVQDLIDPIRIVNRYILRSIESQLGRDKIESRFFRPKIFDRSLIGDQIFEREVILP